MRSDEPRDTKYLQRIVGFVVLKHAVFFFIKLFVMDEECHTVRYERYGLRLRDTRVAKVRATDSVSAHIMNQLLVREN